jgi:hypothetical protein
VFPAYAQAHIVGVRSTELFLEELRGMDVEERAELFREMAGVFAPALAPTVSTPDNVTWTTSSVTESAREVITVTDSTDRGETTPQEPDAEPVTSSPEADPAEEPPTHSARQADIARRIRVALITRGVA